MPNKIAPNSNCSSTGILLGCTKSKEYSKSRCWVIEKKVFFSCFVPKAQEIKTATKDTDLQIINNDVLSI